MMGPAPRGGDAANSSSYTLIESQSALAEFCHRIASAKRLAVDTEFVGERTYWPILELIQVSDGLGHVGLIDVRAVPEAKPLAKLLGDVSREKILHSANQDIALLERYLGVPPLPVFDTQIAAAMAGLGAQVSYANLVRDCLGGKVDKKHTVSDWSKRPLGKGQLEYAAVDVEHLHGLRDHLAERLESLGRVQWFVEEQAKRAEEARRIDGVDNEEMHMTVKEWSKLSERKLAILRELAVWREMEARKQNVPRRMVMPDHALIALAQIAPESREEVKGHRQIPAGQFHRHIDTLIPLIKKAKELPREKWPHKEPAVRPDVPAGFVELMQALVRCIAEEEKIASTLLATSAELTALVNNRTRLEELDLPVLQGWRRELIGEKLVELMEGKMHVKIVGGEHVIFERERGGRGGKG